MPLLHHLLLQSTVIKDAGLFYGKTGIAIFFFCYSKKSEDIYYQQIAEEILDEIWEEKHASLPFGFASGICGVGWGINYLLYHSFVEGESYNICEEINNRIMETAPGRIKDYSLENGMEGLLRYITCHLSCCNSQGSPHPFDPKYLQELYEAVLNIPVTGQCSTLKRYSRSYIDWYEKQKILESNLSLDFCKPVKKSIKRRSDKYGPGLMDGISGYLMHQITHPI